MNHDHKINYVILQQGSTCGFYIVSSMVTVILLLCYNCVYVTWQFRPHKNCVSGDVEEQVKWIVSDYVGQRSMDNLKGSLTTL